ncbi:MAG: hypothetical protein INQ03_13060 [Candidatus Heimdallarchaeota archaeon]|nr:hypothetical protein [Candidatus Heimdallarchaeota archaeon]
MNIRPYVISLAVLGVVAVIFEQVEIGLTLLAAAGLFAFASFIVDRLRRIGVESWVLGSIVVGIGFTLLAVVLIGLAWNILDYTLGIILVILSVFLMVLGYTTEYFDLNVKLIEFYNKSKVQITEALNRFRARVFHSVFTGIAFILSLILLASFFYEPLITSLLFLPIHPRWAMVILILFCLAIEVRELVITLLNRLLHFLLLLLQGLFRRIRNFPGIVKRLLINLADSFQAFLRFLATIFRFTFSHSYIVGFIAFAVFGIISLVTKDDILGSFSIILLFTSLTIVIQIHRQSIEENLRSTQASAYRTSFRVRNIFKKKQLSLCFYCERPIQPGFVYCVSCNQMLPSCFICRNTIGLGDEYEQCDNCEYHFHSSHLEKWLSIINTCPICKTEWKSRE